MKKTQLIELASLVKVTIVSFLSIVLFVGMGITLYAGLTWTASSYEENIDSALNEGNAYDLQIASSLGLTDENLAAVARVDGVTAVDPAYVSYQTIHGEDGDLHCAVYSMTDNVNTLAIKEGTLPTKPGEIALLYNSTLFSDYKVGDTITFEADGADSATNDGMKYLTQRTYTITALVISSEYLCNYLASLGVNGDGQQVTCVMFAAKSAFDADAFGNAYPLAYLACNSLRDESAFSDDYSNGLAGIKASVVQLGEGLAQERYQSVKDEADEKISKNEKKLKRAKAKIDQGEKRIASAESKLGTERSELEGAQAKLDKSTADFDSSKKQGEAKLARGKQRIEAYKEKLSKARQRYDKGAEKVRQSERMAASLEKISSEAKDRYAVIKDGALEHGYQWVAQKCDENNEQVAADIAQFNKEFPDHPSRLDGLLAGLTLDIDNIQTSGQNAYESAEGLSVASKKIREKAAAGKTKLAKLKDGIDKLKTGIADAKAKLASGQSSYDEKTESAKGQLDSGRAKIDSGKSKLTSAQGKLAKEKKRLKRARAKYKEGKEQLAEAKKTASQITPFSWTVNTRDYNSAVQMVNTTCETLRSLRFTMASLFIVIGLLVCYSVMSRLVYERMKLLGTKKALGFKRSEISRQFLGYSFLACVVGITLGVAAGAPAVEMILIPSMHQYIWQEPEVFCNLMDIVGIGLLQIVLIGAFSWLACRSILRKNAVDLLAGQRPTRAKRRFYEGWRIWGKMGLLTQTMVNNCLNDRRRMFATLVGVAGCTALIVCAMTLQAGIYNTTEAQDKVIERYNLEVYVSDSSQASDSSGTTVDGVLSSYGIKSVVAMRNQMGIDLPDGTQSITTVLVPQSNDDINSIMTLQLSEGSGTLDDQGALVSCAYGNYFGAKVGDKITLTKSNGDTYQVPIAGFFNYYGGINMVIMSSQTYRSYLGGEPSFTARLLDTDTGSINEEELRDALRSADDFAELSDSRAISHTISNSINKLAMTVVAVYISISALVALFVLLNLDVMFVAEKKRELIVMMVNGYTRRDAKKYVSRDSIIMNSLGMVVGCALGTCMGIMAIKSIENSMLAFIENPSATACVVGIVVCGAFSFIVMRIALRKVNKYRLTEAAD